MSFSRIRQILRLWVPVIGWMAVIFVLSAQSTLPTIPESATGRGLQEGRPCPGLRHPVRPAGPRTPRGAASIGADLLAALVISALYGASDELHQSLVPGRTPTGL